MLGRLACSLENECQESGKGAQTAFSFFFFQSIHTFLYIHTFIICMRVNFTERLQFDLFPQMGQTPCYVRSLQLEIVFSQNHHACCRKLILIIYL